MFFHKIWGDTATEKFPIKKIYVDIDNTDSYIHTFI